MNARVETQPACEVCPTTMRHPFADGAQRVAVFGPSDVARTAFGLTGVLPLPLTEPLERPGEVPRQRKLVLAGPADEPGLKATCHLVVHQGIIHVSHLQGGLEEWARKGSPIRDVVPLGAVTAASCCGAPARSETAACDVAVARPQASRC